MKRTLGNATVMTGHSRPFKSGGFVFAHSGTLEISGEIKSLLGKYEKLAKKGDTGTILFWQIMKMLDAYKDPATALEMAIDEINTVWLSVKNSRSGLKAPYKGLNILLSDGKKLWALRDNAPANAKAEGASCGPLLWRKSSDGVIFSDQPATDACWRKMQNLQIAETDIGGAGARVKFKKIKKVTT